MLRFTQSEKRITLTLIVISAVFVLIFFTGIPEEPVPSSYIIGIIILVIAVEIYLFLSCVSNRFKNRYIYASLQINGVSDKSKTCVNVDGKLMRRFTGVYNGTIKLRIGEHRIEFFDKSFSISKNVEITDGLMIFVEVERSIVSIDFEHKERKETEKERRERLRSDFLTNLFFFVLINLFAVLAIMRFNVYGIL